MKPTGVARYAREVVTALDCLIAEGNPLTENLELRIVAPCSSDDALSLDYIPLTRVSELRPRLPQVWVQLQLPRHTTGGLLSLCNLAPVSLRRQIVCIHDLQTYTTPQSYGRLFRLMHRFILPRLGHRAAKITTVSNLSREQLAAFGVAPVSQTVVTYNGADHALRWRPDRSTRAWPMRRPFVVGIGRREAHKNMQLVRRLARPLDALGIDVALIGDVDAASLADSDRAPSNLHLLGRLSDDEIAAVFAEAICLVFPSRTEGFGLPAVEAMVRGCPVIASTAPCLPEICGDGALYAAPDDVDGWVRAIEAISSDPALRQSLIRTGRERAARYAWKNVALIYLRLMAEIDEAATSTS